MPPDGNWLGQVGVDTQLVTAGAAGGLARALVARQKLVDALASIVVGAILANYAAVPAATMLSKIEVNGLRFDVQPALGGVFLGVFSYLIIEATTKWLRGKLGQKEDPKP